MRSSENVANTWTNEGQHLQHLHRSSAHVSMLIRRRSPRAIRACGSLYALAKIILCFAVSARHIVSSSSAASFTAVVLWLVRPRSSDRLQLELTRGGATRVISEVNDFFGWFLRSGQYNPFLPHWFVPRRIALLEKRIQEARELLILVSMIRPPSRPSRDLTSDRRAYKCK